MDLRIVDYNASNLGSVRKAIVNIGFTAGLATSPEQVLRADRLVLPGVGAAGEALARLRALGMDEALNEAVRERGRPLLGICLGMQMLGEKLYEYGEHRGLGWIAGDVVSLRQAIGNGLSVPHMGWNRIERTDCPGNLFASVRGKRDYYFAHSYTLRVDDPGVVAAYTDYGEPLVAAIQWQTVFATQFHPEKSQLAGEKLLKAFLDWTP